MTTELILPKFNMDMESAVLVQWLVEDGAMVAVGDPVAEIETDKVNMEVEATASGILCGLRFSPGDMVPVTAPIASIAADEQAAAEVREALSREAKATALPTPPARASSAPETAAAEEPVALAVDAARHAAPAAQTDGSDRRVRASPAIRRQAREHGIDLAALVDAGGRVTPAAMRAAIGRKEGAVAVKPRAPAAPAVEQPAAAAGPRDAVMRAPLDATRRAIAERMTRASQVPQITLTLEARAGALVRTRDESVARPSFTAIFAVAVAKAIRDHPIVNSTFEDDEVATYSAVHLGIAVARPNGLIVPVLRDADRLTVLGADRMIRDLVARAREGKIRLDEVSGGTFTITSLGEAGIDHFTPLLNPPQVAILAIGRIAPRLVPVENGIAIEPTVHLSLACDHRVIDGAPGAAFLGTLKGLLEAPTWLVGSLETAQRRAAG